LRSPVELLDFVTSRVKLGGLRIGFMKWTLECSVTVIVGVKREIKGLLRSSKVGGVCLALEKSKHPAVADCSELVLELGRASSAPGLVLGCVSLVGWAIG